MAHGNVRHNYHHFSFMDHAPDSTTNYQATIRKTIFQILHGGSRKEIYSVRNIGHLPKAVDRTAMKGLAKARLGLASQIRGIHLNGQSGFS
ncbi:uncharacterized protein Bfra_003356 [Botrytis fragariae]|uniref:Uncharacterized protein n=1 Tax=Botrytis fragariae TaxID=1964551 RepID=A0A8H6EK79_9HELO|nr:uncharacterized protein Bfra_003356 [Botrytis fragariae]KAF5874905.1 hypothetical protein Bfra_003356 [Botrytis fragariae]